MARRAITLVAAIAVLTGSLPASSDSSFAVVVHRSNPASNIRPSDLRAFFSGESKHWPNGQKVVLAERDLESDVFRFLTQRILNSTVVEYQRHLAMIELKGDTPVTVRILNSDAAVCKFVFNVPGSIALIGINSLALPECGAVQLISVDGKLPGEERYRLR